MKYVYSEEMVLAKKLALELYFKTGYNSAVEYLSVCVRSGLLSVFERSIVMHDVITAAIEVEFNADDCDIAFN